MLASSANLSTMYAFSDCRLVGRRCQRGIHVVRDVQQGEPRWHIRNRSPGGPLPAWKDPDVMRRAAARIRARVWTRIDGHAARKREALITDPRESRLSAGALVFWAFLLA